MAAYPTTGLTVATQTQRLDGLVGVRATNGALKVRKTMSGEKYEWDIEHELSLTNKDALETFYQANKLINFDFTYPGGSLYTCRFLAAPIAQYQPGGWYKVRVRIAEV
jgi:hypothetical protein